MALKIGGRAGKKRAAGARRGNAGQTPGARGGAFRRVGKGPGSRSRPDTRTRKGGGGGGAQG